MNLSSNWTPARKSRLIRYLTGYDGIIILNTHETWLIRSLEGWRAFFMFEEALMAQS
jgi:hypothetical protein